MTRNTIDAFFDKQPKRLFEEDLKKIIVPKIPRLKKAAEGAIELRYAYLNEGAFKGEENLFSVFSDFQVFLKENNLDGSNFGVSVLHRKDLEKEEYILEVTKREIFVFASETEGVRRGLIRLEDLLLQGSGTLPLGSLRQKAVIKRRISRCFFSPTNRPPRNGAELGDDVDYYPDGYLNRLMHDGINGIWIYSSFDELLKSSLIEEFGQDSEKRIQKLNRTIEKCAKYGIDVFLFALEPIALTNPAVVKRHGNLLGKYSQVLGNRIQEFRGDEVIDHVAFCTYTDFGKRYCYEAMEKLFTLAPKLGGFISITQGERVTSCSTVWTNDEFEWTNTCPHCSKYSRSEILSQKVETLREGMRRVKPSAEFISWTYEHRLWDFDEIGEYVEKAPTDVVLMQNFEDNGRCEQLGKKRVAIDYWLAYDGPSDMFSYTAQKARENRKDCYAKMQVCCSHEIASVPYIPVPGLIYDKFTRAKELGVTGVMESWYFGNYPCLMSKAAEILSFDRTFSSKREFLSELAKLYYSETDAPFAERAWEYFEKAYRQYPVNVMFSYYGPMHDGVVWELALLPKNYSLSRSWLLIDPADGDRIGECLFSGHTVSEALMLLCEMHKWWQKGLDELSKTSQWDKNFEQITVAKALGVLIESGKNIIEFYKLRNDLGYERGNLEAILKRLFEIVSKEILQCDKMSALCKVDNRLGFHSEAEGFKFFPEKLESRKEKLKTLLTTEFPIVKQRIYEGKMPLAYFNGEEEGVKSYTAGKNGLENTEWEFLSDNESKFKVAIANEEICVELYSSHKTDFMLCNEFELFFPAPQVVIKSDGRVNLYRDCMTHQSILDERVEEEKGKWQVEDISNGLETHLIVKIDKKSNGFVRLPYKMLLKTTDGAIWQKDERPVRTLGKVLITPRDFGWIK